MSDFEKVSILVTIFTLFLSLLTLYILPIILAFIYKSENRVAVILLTLLGGWTFVLWIVALILSLKKEENKQIIINNINGESMGNYIEPQRENQKYVLIERNDETDDEHFERIKNEFKSKGRW